MQIKKWEEVKPKEKGIVLFTILSILLIIGVFFYNSFAIFHVNKNQNLIEGNLEDPGDIYFAFYKDGKIQNDMPNKEEGYRLDTRSSYCGINGQKNSNVSVSMTNEWTIQVKGMTTSRTKCNLYFKKASNFIKTIQNLSTQNEDSGASGLYLVDHSESDITWQGTNEQVNHLKETERRYAGKNYDVNNNLIDYVHNYINIDEEIWRIIGLVNTPEGQRIKIVKDESIGNLTWNSSASSINHGYGINEWSEADLMKLLNNGYDRNELENSDGMIQKNEYANNSLYWNGEKGKCYQGDNKNLVDCDFKENKISENIKNIIEEITWNIGSDDGSFQTQGNVLKSYEYERSKNLGKACYHVVWCNDETERTTSWKGKVGLIYPSDYGYATIGGTESKRTECLNQNMSTWKNNQDCYKNNWLFRDGEYWTLSPLARPEADNASIVATVITDGSIYNGYTSSRYLMIFPTVYLRADVLLVTGDGSFDNEFLLSL